MAIRDHYNKYTTGQIVKPDFDMIKQKNTQNKEYVEVARKAAQPEKHIVT